MGMFRVLISTKSGNWFFTLLAQFLAHWCPVYNSSYYCYWTFITSVKKRIKRHETNCRLNSTDNNIREFLAPTCKYLIKIRLGFLT